MIQTPATSVHADRDCRRIDFLPGLKAEDSQRPLGRQVSDPHNRRRIIRVHPAVLVEPPGFRRWARLVPVPTYWVCLSNHVTRTGLIRMHDTVAVFATQHRPWTAHDMRRATSRAMARGAALAHAFRCNTESVQCQLDTGRHLIKGPKPVQATLPLAIASHSIENAFRPAKDNLADAMCSTKLRYPLRHRIPGMVQSRTTLSVQLPQALRAFFAATC